ncbi:MAG: ABC transporter permease [Alphaproteobacteria bacterium]
MTDATKPGRDGRGWLERNLALVTTPAILLLFLVAWTAYVQHFKVSRYLLPEPLAIGRALLDLVRQPYFHDAVLVTASEVLSGFAIAIAAGATLGVAIGKSRLFERVVSPFIVASQVTPKVALMPLFLLWLGFGMQSKIAMVALLSFFPVMKATILGVRSIQPDQRALFAVIRAPWWKRIVSLEVPAVMPYMLTGIETASVLAVTGAIVGEYLGGNEGLGALVVKTLNALMVEHMFATVIALACLGFAFYGAITSIRRFAVPWHESSQDDE